MNLVAAAAPIFTACPDAANARVLRTELNGRIRKDLETFCGIAKKALPAEAATALRAIHDIPVTSRLSPLVYFWHQDLQAALRAQHVAGARNALQELTRVAQNGIASCDPLRLGTVASGPMHDALKRIASSHSDTSDSPEERTAIRPLTSDHEAVVAGWLEAAAEKMAKADPDMLGELRELVSEVRMYEGEGPQGVTSVLAFGAIFVRWPGETDDGTAYMIENLAHEGSHLALYALMALDPLVLNAHAGTFASPLRKDPRPLYGIIHQVFVLARLHRLWDRLVQMGEAWAEGKLIQDHQAFQDGYRVLRDHAELTRAGELVIGSLPRCCR